MTEKMKQECFKPSFCYCKKSEQVYLRQKIVPTVHITMTTSNKIAKNYFSIANNCNQEKTNTN